MRWISELHDDAMGISYGTEYTIIRKKQYLHICITEYTDYDNIFKNSLNNITVHV